MFSRQLLNADASKVSKNTDVTCAEYRLGDFGYGKRDVRIFQLKKNGPVHSITEFKVHTQMRLSTNKEYYEADNTDIVGSDVLETHCYLHAQKYGLTTPEAFALSITQFYLETYEQAMETNVIVEDEFAWSRLGAHEQQSAYQQRLHNHTFTTNANGSRFCEVVRKRENAHKPLLISGIKDFRIIKTARAPFTGYIKGAYFTEGDHLDRLMCVDINAKWQYSHVDANVDYDKYWHKVRDVILNAFAGDAVEGVDRTSVQIAAYAAGRAVLDAMPEICSVSISLPGYMYYPYDFKRFPQLEQKANVIICNPYFVPHKIGYAQVDRIAALEEDKQNSTTTKINSKI